MLNTTKSISTTAESDVLFWKEESSDRPGYKRIRMRISGLHCSLCTGTIEKALSQHQGVDKVAVSLTHEQALVEFNPLLVEATTLIKTLYDMGYTVSDPRKLRPFEEEERTLINEGRRFFIALGLSLVSIALIAPSIGLWSILCALVLISLVALAYIALRGRGLFVALIGASSLAALSLLLYLARSYDYLTANTSIWITATLAFVLVFGFGSHILSMAIQALRRGILNQHVLLEMGGFAGIAGGIIGLTIQLPDYPTEAFFAVTVMVLTYHLFSEWLSLIVKTRSSQAVKKLLALQPEIARIVKDGNEREVRIEDVKSGDQVRIRPGERVPIDGVVIDGHSTLDESFVTGESVPVEKKHGSAVIGGSINGNGTLLVKVTAVGEASFLQQVVRHVEDARALKPGLLHLVDRVLRVYTPTVLTIAVLAVIGWLVGSSFIYGIVDIQRAAFAGISVLVMGYPCAVGISAPLAIVSGTGEAADKGILMRTGEAFQALRLVTCVVLDKTGTLTEGKPLVREMVSVLNDEKAFLALAAGAEAVSEHPLAKAIVNAAFDREIAVPAAEDFYNQPGKGVIAKINGHEIVAGSPAFLKERGVNITSLDADISRMENASETVIAISQDDLIMGVLGVGDALREDATQTITALHKAGVETVLLTGDNERTARRIAEQAGIDKVYAGVLPGDKAAVIRQLQQNGKVAMVGDGINDAPALMQAEVGIAMGSGTDIAIDSADIIILNSRLKSILDAYEISRSSYRRMVQNITLAFMFNGIGIPLAITGLIYPVWAMAAMAASITTIFLNSLRGRPRLFYDAMTSVGSQIKMG
ncbi:MAG: copper-translocating P-type ATPase [Legionella sp. 40-6]|nr:cation-translocating P-type ATPase [Legionella sp.]OJY43980.1 MAG: copper-translocating P-type ATPase [Legionella sp. 40-6]